MDDKTLTTTVTETIDTLKQRPRRLRRNELTRRLMRENYLTRDDLVYPLFVRAGQRIRQPVSSMPGVFQLSIDELLRESEAALELGVPAVLLFGVPEHKDSSGSAAWQPGGIIQQAVAELKRALPELFVITDVCFCEYTDHGHCGPLDEKGRVKNDETLLQLARQSVSHAECGADMLAPSGMIDGMVKVMRATLDKAGFAELPIMSYAVKYASGFYGPFREAAECAPTFGDRRTHQMDPANTREALLEARLDVEEGADIIMVKPAGPYLDIIQRLRQELVVPIAAYNVSGEYSMIKAAAQNGWIDEQRVAVEYLTGIKRAGADMILTYYARELLQKKWI